MRGAFFFAGLRAGAFFADRAGLAAALRFAALGAAFDEVFFYAVFFFLVAAIAFLRMLVAIAATGRAADRSSGDGKQKARHACARRAF